ncbi:prolyl-tRNA editing protein [Enterococcus florum]|uniref:Prolyl-tRNA editing protein n=1 Tax=Enterococcus florum TaxID=2480627 RepID=A0A4P5PBG5_9ENTE|nr:prolyl-tRNA synthetase associated domain-containing protein [Enterococcus florum]GCF95525.1 prolyl-tRNA editing protein [Enterococcus florum]
MKQATEQEVYPLLEELNIPYEKVAHQAVYTVAEIDFSINGTEVKNLLMKSKKSGRFYFVICPSEKRLNIKALAQALGEKQLSFASADELMALLGLTPGSVTPLALPHDDKRKVTVVIDLSIDQQANIGFHPNTNTATLVLAFGDFQRYLTALNRTPIYAMISD